MYLKSLFYFTKSNFTKKEQSEKSCPVFFIYIVCSAGYHGPHTTGTAAICINCPEGTWSANGAIDSSECTSKSNEVHTAYWSNKSKSTT